MLRISAIDWPIQQAAAPQPHHLPGGVAPLRHDLALTRYVENRLRYDQLAGRRLAIWRALVDIYRGVEHRAIAILRGASVARLASAITSSKSPL